MNDLEKAAPLPVAKMNEGVAPGRLQYENWRAGAQAVYEFIALDGPDAFFGTGYAYSLPDLIVAYTRRSGGLCLREDRHIEQSGPVFWLQRCIEGSARIYLDAETCLLEPGTVVLCDMRQPSATHGGVIALQTVVVPAERLHNFNNESARVRCREFSRDTPHGKMLDDAIDELFAALPHATLAEAPVLQESLLDLINGLLSVRPNQRQSARIRAAMFVSMKRYLHARLDDATIGAEDLCSAFHVSRATVFRIFAPVGGVHHYLRGQRLIKACEELTTRAHEKVTIREVAEQWGFDDPSHFNHLFKKAFGITPSAAIRRAKLSEPEIMEPAGTAGDIARFQDWMRY